MNPWIFFSIIQLLFRLFGFGQNLLEIDNDFVFPHSSITYQASYFIVFSFTKIITLKSHISDDNGCGIAQFGQRGL